MPLDAAEVRRIARLARLELSAEEEDAFVHQMGEIVAYFDQLKDFDVAEPGDDIGPASGVEADDVPGPTLDRRSFSANAPDHRDGFLVVPRIKDAD